MLPTLRQRLILLVGLLAGVWLWMQSAHALRAADLSPGITLTDAAAGVLPAFGYFLAGGAAAIAAGLLAGSTGNVLSGPFVISAALLGLAGVGGSIDGVLRRSAEADTLAALYPKLAGEIVAMTVGLVLFIFVLAKLRPWLRERLPGRLISYDKSSSRWSAKVARPDASAALAGLITMAAGGLFASVLIRSSANQQVIGALLLAFTVAGMLGRMLVNRPNVIGILLAPGVTGLIAYAWAWRVSGDGSTVMARYFAGEWPPLALALPIHYLSAGLLGAALGAGLGQGLLMGSHQARLASTPLAAPPREAVEAKPTTTSAE